MLFVRYALSSTLRLFELIQNWGFRTDLGEFRLSGRSVFSLDVRAGVKRFFLSPITNARIIVRFPLSCCAVHVVLQKSGKYALLRRRSCELCPGAVERVLYSALWSPDKCAALELGQQGLCTSFAPLLGLRNETREKRRLGSCERLSLSRRQSRCVFCDFCELDDLFTNFHL